MAQAKWARWQWSKGLGRAHRLFNDGDLTKTACQKPRKSASHAAVETFASKPAAPVCPTCELFDQLHEKFVATTDAIATTTITVSTPEPVLMPAGVCICGAASCNTEAAVAVRAQIAAYEVALSAARHAEFEALVASGQVAS